jgi:hypothetical protein
VAGTAKADVDAASIAQARAAMTIAVFLFAFQMFDRIRFTP